MMTKKHDAAQSVRRVANISLNASLLEEARALGIDVSYACEAGLEAQISRSRCDQWLAENKQAFESSNAYVEANGLPHAKLFRF